MAFKLATVFIALIASVAAYCPNSCSGHGSCGTHDKCTCYLKTDGTSFAWQGADCSERICPTGLAWAGVVTTTNDAHASSECSAKGACDRDSGECKCFDGYEGVACERHICPNDCSGNGFCYTQKDILAAAPTPIAYVGWDYLKAVGCVCDLGFRGADCSLRECPSGADVMGGTGASSTLATGRDCSGRGLCDYTSGLCKCFSGFYGTKCESQTILN